MNDLNVELNRATIDDAQALLEMQKTCFAPHLQRYQDYEVNPAMMKLDRLKWLIENENFYKIIYNNIWAGAINIRKLDSSGHYKLHIIYVLPEFQNRHIGQSAIQLAENLFGDAKSWCLETLEDMPSNRRVYEKMGYRFTGETQKINDKLTLVLYHKEVHF